MKIKLVLLVLCTTFFLSQAQDKQNPTIHKLRNGTIGAVEFSLTEESPSSAQAFFQEYLKIKPDDDFRKEEHRSKREGLVHEHYVTRPKISLQI